MNTITTDFVRQRWQCKPEFTTADTSSCISNAYCTTTSTSIADEIDKRIKELYRRREIEMTGVSFNDLEKDLKELGIELSTIRHSSGECGCEIDGYFNPNKYKIYRGRERCSVPITPKKPLPKKVIFSGPATTILWQDGTKTTVKCSAEDVWDDDVGIAMCYLKKMLGNKGNFNNIFREAMKVAVTQESKGTITSSIEVGELYAADIDRIKESIKRAADALNKAAKEEKK